MLYRLYLDEVGNDDLSNVSDERHRFLSLTGVIIARDYARDVAVPQMAKLKSNIFQHDPENHIIFHRKEIMQKKGPFGILQDAEKCLAFDTELIKYLNDVEYSVVTVVLDKKGMLNQPHWRDKHPYHYLMGIIIEKYAQWLQRKNSQGDIMPEKRHGRKDTDLQRAYEIVRNTGTYYVPASRIKDRIPSTQLKFRAKRDNVAGLQICDLIAYPSHCYVQYLQGHTIKLGPFSEKVISLLTQAKYDRSGTGRLKGYGIKYLP